MAGNDTLDGGLDSHADQFVFDTALNATSNVDTVFNFDRADLDKIVVENAVLTSVGAAGALAAGALANWDAPDQADDRIIFRHVDSNGDAARDMIDLYYDPTGGSTADAVLFAHLVNQPTANLTASDFLIT